MLNNNQNDTKKDAQNIDPSNIFEDFQDSKVFEQDIKNIEKEKQRDMFFYLKSFTGVVKYINIFLLVITLVVYAYVYIQNDETGRFYNNDMLNLFCPILLGNNTSTDNINCSSVTSITKAYEDKIKVEQEIYVSKIIPMIKEMYGVYDFVNSEKVAFVVNKTNEKINPVTILEEFEKLKNDFSGIDRGQVQCYGTKISGDSLSTSCSVYARGWDSNILSDTANINGDKLTGTSITKASSFLNYIEVNKKFKLINKQKHFSSEKLIGPYASKTNVSLELLYNTDNLILK